MSWLTEEEREILSLVLELRPEQTKKGNPGLQALSLYSTELKNLKQIAQEVQSIHDGTFTAHEERTKARYFRTLVSHGVATGSQDLPALTPLASIVLRAAAAFDGTSDYWQRHRDEVETPLFEAQVEKIQCGEGDDIAEVFKRVFWNVQNFFDLIPAEEIEATLNDLELLKILQFINSVGFEIGRFFRLNKDERTRFIQAMEKILSTIESGNPDANVPIELAAQAYGKAAKQYQADVRYRVAGFLRAFHTVKERLGSGFPRLDRQLTFSAPPALATTQTRKLSSDKGRSADRKPLAQPYQLIVSGCPGSGKSFHVEQMLAQIDCDTIRTQFHAETSYFDFVGTYKPSPVYEAISTETVISSADGATFDRGRPIIDYRFVAGPFTQALITAFTNPDRNVVLLVEELNRGNCAAIFGDMFQLLDRQENGDSKYGIIPNPDLAAYLSQQGLSASGEKLALPGNLYIWATMNSADQGVFPLDTAFRRRWDYVYKGHAELCQYSADNSRLRYGGKVYDWDEFRTYVNKKLRQLGIHEDKLIGPYFLTPGQIRTADGVLNKLFLYLWDDVLRFRQKELFAADNFSEVQESWQNGNGTPLTLTMEGLAEIQVQQAEDISPSPDASPAEGISERSGDGSNS